MNPLRNTGRTYRALKRAIESLDKCPVCIYLLLNDDAVDDLDSMVRWICHLLGKRIVYRAWGEGRSYGFSDNIDALLQLRVADVNVCRGKCAHFVIDHAVGENMLADEYKEMLEAIYYCDPLGCDTSDETPKEAV